MKNPGLGDGWVFRHAPHGIALLSSDLALLEVNPALCMLLGYSREELVGRNLSEVSAIGDAKKAEVYLRLVRDRGISEGRCEKAFIHKDGHGIAILVSITSLRDAEGRIQQHIAQFVDISEQQRQLSQIERLTRHYRVLSSINQLITHVADEAALYAGVCRIAVDEGQMAMAWIGSLDSDSGDLVPLAAHGEGCSYVDEIRVSIRAEIPHGQGPGGRALREGQVAVCNDFLHDVTTGAWHQQASEYGWASCIAIPLRHAGKSIGLLSLYARSPGIFDKGLVKLHQKLGKDISFALDSIASERERDAYRQELMTTRDSLVHIIEASPTVIYRCAPDGHFTFMSHHISRLLGYEAEDFLREASLWQDRIHPLDSRRIMASRIARSAAQHHMQEYRIQHQQGHYIWLHDERSLITDGQGEPVEIIGSLLEIGDRKLAEERVQRLTRFYHTLSQVNEAIVRVAREDDLLPYLCRLAVDFSDLDAAWIGLPDEQQRIQVIASAGEGRELLDQVFISVDEHLLEGQGLVGRAWRSSVPVIENDFQQQKSSPWYNQISRVGLRSGAAFPVRRSGVCYAVFVVYSRQEDVFDADVRRLLKEMAGNMSYALDRIDEDRRRREYEEQLRLYAQVFTHGREAILIADSDNRIVSVNRAFTLITGYTEDEVRGKNPGILASERQDATFYQSMWMQLEEQGHWEGEIWNRRKDGTNYPEWLVISVVKDEQDEVNHYVAIFTDLSQQKAAAEKISRLAHYDPLTGLPNRVLLEDISQRAIASAQRQGLHMAVLFLDLDRFKNVNDSLGHAVGDLLLQEVGSRLESVVRDVDIVARLGGDEFVLILQNTSDEGAAHVAEKISVTIARPMVIEGHQLNIASSIGVSLYPENGQDFYTLLRNADTAMYRAKGQANAKFCFFTQEMQVRVMRQLELETQLRGVLERGELVVHYQPQVDLKSGRIIGAEALLRWQHPEWGLVSPGEFIPVAEESGLILPIGRWVLESAIMQNRLWQDEGLAAIRVSVNLSLRQFQQDDLAEQVENLLTVQRLDPCWLELELTESIAMQEADEAVRVTGALNRLGVALSIDDFGTGYSSLSYLKRFSLTRLKIDISFIRDIVTDPEDEAIVDTIISMASNLGLKTVAEGVETRQQRDLLIAKGCDEMQGFYFSKPLPAAEFAELLRRQ